MAGTRKAAIVHQFNKPLRIEQVAIPKPAERKKRMRHLTEIIAKSRG